MRDWVGPTFRFFELHEFACKCGCGQNGIDTDFVWRLDLLRERCGFPFIISSGYRCPDHNVSVSSTGRSGPHTTGRAADVAVFGEQAHTLIGHASKFGMTGIGINQKGDFSGRFIHLDMLQPPGHPRPNVWTY